MRCEGYRKHGNAFTMGRPEWVQCINQAIVVLLINQYGDTNPEMVACDVCLKESKESENIEIISIKRL